MINEINQADNQRINPKKRVLFVITQSEFGGAQRFLYNLLSRLDHSKYELLAAIGTDGNGELISALKQKNVSVLVVEHLVRNINVLQDIKALGEFKKL